MATMRRKRGDTDNKCRPSGLRMAAMVLASSFSRSTGTAYPASTITGPHKIAIESTATTTIKTTRSPADKARFQRYREQRQERIQKLKNQIQQQEAKRLQQEEQHRQLGRDSPDINNNSQLSANGNRYLDTGCSLCYDGSAIPDPSQPTTIAADWTCGRLQTFVANNLAPGEMECAGFQTVGKSDCGCPTSPLDNDFCAMCTLPGGSAKLIPDSYLDLPIPVTEEQTTPGLTCEDLVFTRREGAFVSCDSLDIYGIYCGCPVGLPATLPDAVLTSSPTMMATTAPTMAAISYQIMSPTETGDLTDGDSGTSDVEDPVNGDNDNDMDGPIAIDDEGDSGSGGDQDEESDGGESDGPADQDETSDGGESDGTSDTSDAPVEAEDGLSCFLCPEQDPPQFGDRMLPYLSPAPSPQSNSIPLNEPAPNAISTCGMLATAAQTINDASQCFNYIAPTVPLDVQSFCGCTSAETWDLCSLCEEGQPLVNPNLNVPGAGGLTCLDLQEYLRFITEEDSCNTIAESARETCCTTLPDCPVCVNPVFSYSRDKLYPPFGLTCSQLPLAEQLGNDVTCPEIQERFGWYCGCPNAVRPTCSLCSDLLPEPDRPIPALGPGITCGEVNDYASLRPSETCEEQIASWSIDTRAYCGCPGFEPRGECRLECPDGLVINSNALVPDPTDPISVAAMITCASLYDLAPFVTGSELCSAMQDSAGGCCVPANEIAADGASEGSGRNGDGGFLSYPFYGDTPSSSDSSNIDNGPVYERTFVQSPYGSPNSYKGASSSSSSTTTSLIGLTLSMAVLVGTMHLVG